MKLLYIVNARIPTEKAHGLQIMKSCEAFARAGVQLELWLPARETHIKENAFEYYSVEQNFTIRKVSSFDAFRIEKYIGRLAFPLQSAFFLARLAISSTEPNTLVYTRNLAIAWLFTRKWHKVVYEAHQWPVRKGWLFTKLLTRVYLVVCNSQGTEAEFIKRGFRNTIAVPNGVDLSIFNRSSSAGDERTRLGLPAGKKIVMYTGHLYAWKGVDVVLQIAKRMSDTTQYVFVLVGGTEGDIQKYSNQIKKENISNVILCGHQEPSEMPSYLSCADVLLLPNIPISQESMRYTSPIKLFEYMASGKPIVASDLPSIHEILNSSNAFLAIAGNADSFSAGIKKVSEDSAFANSISKQALVDVQNYTWEKRAQKILNFLAK